LAKGTVFLKLAHQETVVVVVEVLVVWGGVEGVEWGRGGVVG
jgi:hypothetical protein